jgi:altronate dehydratase small subunit
MDIRVFLIDESDNVVTNVANEIPKGSSVDVDGKVIVALDDIPYGHKMALRPIAKGEDVLKYGLSIGSALTDIQPGNHLHAHNVESNRGRGDKFENSEGALA